MWQPQEVEGLLYFKQKIQKSGKTLILREMHHEAVLKELTKETVLTSQGNKSATSTTSLRENGR
jgi:hypothetical protein